MKMILRGLSGCLLVVWLTAGCAGPSFAQPLPATPTLAAISPSSAMAPGLLLTATPAVTSGP